MPVALLQKFAKPDQPGLISLLALVFLLGLGVDARANGEPDREEPVTVIHCGHLVDVRAGKLLGETTVAVKEGRIAAVTAGYQKSAGSGTIELRAQTCLPGLIDTHVHLTWLLTKEDYSNKFRWNLADYVLRSTLYARRTLLAGITTVRNLGDYQNESVSLRNAINANVLAGPRIFTAGVPIGSTGGHADPTDEYRNDLAGDPGVQQGVINGIADAVKAVRLHYKLGDDWIKMMPSGGIVDESASGDNLQLSVDKIKTMVTMAHDYGFLVAAHAHGSEAIRRAVLGGVDSIEQGTYMNDEDMQLMKEHGTWYVPTLMAGEFVMNKATIPGYYPPQVSRKAEAVAPQMLSTASRAYNAGLKIAFGTDAGVFPHGDNAHDLELMVQAGMPPMFVLSSGYGLRGSAARARTGFW